MATVSEAGPAVYSVISDGSRAAGAELAFGLMGEDTAGLISDLDRVGIRYQITSLNGGVALQDATSPAAVAQSDQRREQDGSFSSTGL
jgi:hypothetical protein